MEAVSGDKWNKPLSSWSLTMFDVLHELMNPIPQLEILWKADILHYTVYFNLFSIYHRMSPLKRQLSGFLIFIGTAVHIQRSLNCILRISLFVVLWSRLKLCKDVLPLPHTSSCMVLN